MAHMNNFEVFTFLSYIFATVVSFIGFVIFSWWWYKKGAATTVYAYMTLLMGTYTFEKVVESMGYWLFATEDPRVYTFVGSYAWPLRVLFCGGVIFLIVLHVTNRIYNQMKMIKRLKTRRTLTPDDKFLHQVLVVDDHDEITNMVEKGLTFAFPNITIYKASTAEQALALFADHPNINLVITDMLLPKLNGFELCALIKDECPWTVVIGMTGYQSVYEFWAAREIGFDDYIDKPFNVSSLIDIVRSHFLVLERWKTIRMNRPKRKQANQTQQEERHGHEGTQF